MAYIGPMIGFKQEKKNHPEDSKLFEEIVGLPGEEWPEYMQNQKNWTHEDWLLHIRYVNALGSKRIYGYCK